MFEGLSTDEGSEGWIGGMRGELLGIRGMGDENSWGDWTFLKVLYVAVSSD